MLVPPFNGAAADHRRVTPFCPFECPSMRRRRTIKLYRPTFNEAVAYRMQRCLSSTDDKILQCIEAVYTTASPDIDFLKKLAARASPGIMPTPERSRVTGKKTKAALRFSAND
jgi:hypothetical protein